MDAMGGGVIIAVDGVAVVAGVAGVDNGLPNMPFGAGEAGVADGLPFKLNGLRPTPVPNVAGTACGGGIVTREDVSDRPNGGFVTGVIGGRKDDRPEEGAGGANFAGVACAWLFAFWGVPNIGGEAGLSNKLLNGGVVGGALVALGGKVEELGVGVAGVVAGFGLPKDRRGGVLGLGGSLLTDALLDSSTSGLSGDGGGMGKIAKRGFGDAGTWGDGTTTSCSSSSRETGVLAKGELRDGRVLGRPKPTPNNGGDAGAGEGDGDFFNGGCSLVGVPGGVVLSSSGMVGNMPGSGESDGEGVTWMDGSSG